MAVCLMALPGCRTHDNYLPLTEGNTWIYEATVGGKPLIISRTVVAQAKLDGEGIYRVVSRGPWATTTQLWKSGPTGVSELVRSLAGRDNYFTAPILRLPVTAKDKITSGDPNSALGLGVQVTSEVISPSVSLKLPVGTVRAVHVRRKVRAQVPGREVVAGTTDYWFTRFVGIVQESHDTANGRVTLKLREFGVR